VNFVPSAVTAVIFTCQAPARSTLVPNHLSSFIMHGHLKELNVVGIILAVMWLYSLALQAMYG